MRGRWSTLVLLVAWVWGPLSGCMSQEDSWADSDSDVDVDSDSDGDLDCPPAPDDASFRQVEALDVANGIREAVGVACLSMSSELNRAAQSHADYGSSNAGVPGCSSSGHDETAGCDGFTGTSPFDRMAAAGYAGGGGGEVVHFRGDPSSAIWGWIVTLWHRVPIVHPNTLDVGYGMASGWDVMDFGAGQAARPDGIWFYPPDGAEGVSPFGGDESPSPPDPPPGCDCGRCWGTFVTVHFDRAATVAIDTHELEGPDGAVEHVWQPPGALMQSTYAFVSCPLASGATYTVHVAGTLNGAPFDRTSSFTTQ